MQPQASISHRLKNRVRFRIPGKRRDFEFFSFVKKKLKSHDKVDSVEVNPLTGSVLVVHQGELATLLQEIETHELFKLEPKSKSYQKWPSDVFDELGTLDQRIKKATDGTFNLAGIAAMTAFGLGIFQISRRQVLPAATTLLSEGFWALAQLSKRNKVNEQRERDEQQMTA